MSLEIDCSRPGRGGGGVGLVNKSGGRVSGDGHVLIYKHTQIYIISDTDKPCCRYKYYDYNNNSHNDDEDDYFYYFC